MLIGVGCCGDLGGWMDGALVGRRMDTFWP